MLKFAILGFLNYFPMTGYALKQIMDESTTNFWFAEQSQIYTTLKKLEQDGLVSSLLEAQENRPDRRIYTITQAGQDELRDWLTKPVVELSPYKEHLLLKLFFSAHLDKQKILTQLRMARGLHAQQVDHYKGETASIIQQYALSQPDWQGDAVFWDATRRFGLAYEEMYIHWLDETINTIENTI